MQKWNALTLRAAAMHAARCNGQRRIASLPVGGCHVRTWMLALVPSLSSRWRHFIQIAAVVHSGFFFFLLILYSVLSTVLMSHPAS
jgi:hypothetical protein